MIQGHDVHVVTTLLPGIDTSRDFNTGSLGVHHVPSPAGEWSEAFARECDEFYGRLRPDILHLDSFDHHNIWWADKRASITMHGFGFGAFLTQWNLFRSEKSFTPSYDSPTTAASAMTNIKLEAEVLAKAEVVIGVSRWEWRMLRDQYGLKQAKLVYNPVAEYFFTDPKSSEILRPKPYFLCVGVSQQATRGFAELTRNDELVIASRTPRREMPKVYDGAKTLLLPTQFCQGFDLSVAEARARGVPAIMSSTGSYLDEAMPWDVLVTPGDREGLREAMASYKGPNPLVWSQSQIRESADPHRPENHVKAWLEAVS